MENHRKIKNKNVYEPDSNIRELVTCEEIHYKTIPLIK